MRMRKEQCQWCTVKQKSAMILWKCYVTLQVSRVTIVVSVQVSHSEALSLWDGWSNGQYSMQSGKGFSMSKDTPVTLESPIIV